MTAPSNTVYADGVGVVTGDQLNTFVQGVANVASFRNFTGTVGMTAWLNGTVTDNDGGQAFFYWDSTSTAADNGTSVIAPYGATVGRWLSTSPTFTNLVVNGTLNVTGATTLGSTLSVAGVSTLAALSATTIAGSGNATVGGTFGVTGAATLGSTLSVSALSTLAGFTSTAYSTFLGSSTNDNASAGYIGEHVANTGSGVSLSNAVNANITSLTLTAGDWDVSGSVAFAPAGSTTIGAISGSLSLISATPPATNFSLVQANFTTGANQAITVPTLRVSIATPTAVYLVAGSNFAVSTMTASGVISARRSR